MNKKKTAGEIGKRGFRRLRSMSLTSNLAENYTYTLEEPHEVEHVLLIFLSEPAFAGIRRRANCDRSNIQCLLESMCAKEVCLSGCYDMTS